MKVLISDKLAEEGLKILKEEKSITVDCKYDLKPDQLKAIIKDYDALIVRSSTQVTAEIITAADKLKFIGRAGVGLDNVDLKAATRKGIVAMNTPAGNTTSTAEHTMSMILALARNIPQAHGSMKAGRWDRNKFSGVELHGKMLGIVGFGRIGSTVARFAKAFNMDIIVYDPFISQEVAEQRGVGLVELEDLLKRADFITIHIPKTSDKSLIGEKELKLMKKNARIINCARGGIIDEGALAAALKEGRIAGAALDVYETEPLSAESPLLKLDNCILTPHLGASTSEAQVNVAIEIAETIRNALLGRGIVNAANFPSVDAESFRILQPYIDLSVRMGKFAGQLISGRLTKIKVTTSGDINKYKMEPITLSLVNGVLTPILGSEHVNYINALDVAKERAINVEEIKSNKDEEFVNCIKVEMTSDAEKFTVWGTLSGNNKPRIVKVNDVYVETIPDGYMLFIKNNDKPGLVGAIGTLLGEVKVNIAGITLGREAQDGVAISLINVDSSVSESVLERIKKTKDVRSVKLLKV